jgi:hypothetical protein
MITYTGVLLRLDGVPDQGGEIFDENTAIELPSHNVPVTLEFHGQPEFWLGNARLYFESDNLKYDMQLDDTRLPKHALEILIPCVGGFVKGRNGKNITHASITSIGLTSVGNADARIKRLKDQT